MSELLPLLSTLMILVFGYYAFHNYKRYIKRHKLRTGLHTELREAKLNFEITRKQNDVMADFGKVETIPVSSKYFDSNLSDLTLLTDIEDRDVLEAFNEINQRQNMVESIVKTDLDEDAGEMSSEPVSKRGLLATENALDTIENQIRKEKSRLLSWNTLADSYIKNDSLDSESFSKSREKQKRELEKFFDS